MKTSILATLCCVAAATAMVIPSNDQQVPLVQSQAEPPDPDPKGLTVIETIAGHKENAQVTVEVLPGSCFCTGGSICCERGGETNCDLGICGI